MNPIAFEIGPIAVHWYGILIVLGILAAAYLSMFVAKLWAEVTDHVHLQRNGIWIVLVCQQELPEVLLPPGSADVAAQLCRDALHHPVNGVQRIIVHSEEVQVFAEAVMQVKGSQSRTAGQEER